jgi:hypothetical protein
MSQQELLRQVLAVLKSARIDYMVTGSVVSSLQGEPRATHDIDFVVQLRVADIDPLINAFPPPRYYLDRFSIESAIQSSGQFNLLDAEEGDKVDFWMLCDEPFDQSRFARRFEEDLGGVRAMISRPEDTILMKPRWADMSGGSEKQMGDCIAIYEVQTGKLDQSYLDNWAPVLNVEPLLREIRSRARPL